ncbi:MAG: VOC family protein [Acidimicrobiia bacterium]
MSLPVSDLRRAVGFYRDVVGLRLVADLGGLAFFDLGGVRLILESEPGPEDRGGGGSSVLYFAVPDIHAARAELGGRGVAFEQEPHVVHVDEDGTFGPAGEEERMAFFRDPDGNLLAIASRERPAR